jgi:signal transduction histidine kinase
VSTSDDRPSGSTALRRAASMLAQDEELKRKKRALAALVVHDLRSPLSGAVGYLGVIREELRKRGDPELATAMTWVDDTKDLLMKALSLVSTILDVDELEDGILRARPVKTDAAKLARAAQTASQLGMDIREQDWRLDVPDGLEVEIDPHLFARVLENLLDNSARYVARGGVVSVTCRVLGAGDGGIDSGIEFAVGNSGPPVPESEREAIFGRYYQVEARRASARANRGLGLYFCKLAAEAHGGSIRVEERGELNAVFVVRVPQPPVLPEDVARRRTPSDPMIGVPRTTTAEIERPRTTTGEVPPIPRPRSPGGKSSDH